MLPNKELLDLIEKIRQGELKGRSIIDVADGDFYVLRLFEEMKQREYVVFQQVGIGDDQIIGITEKGETYLEKHRS